MNTSIIRGDRINCTLTSLEHDGTACVKYQDAILHVPRGVPGDTVALRVKKLKKNFGSAEILELIKPSPHRVRPRCDAFLEGCGGCQWLHIDYPVQLEWKKKIMRKALSRALGTDVKIQPVIGMQNPHGFRNKLSLVRGEEGRFGLMKENSKELVTFETCEQEIPVIRNITARLLHTSFPPAVTQLHLRGSSVEGVGLVMYAERLDSSMEQTAFKLVKRIPSVSAVGVKTFREYFHLTGPERLAERIGRTTYQIPIMSFFQTNYAQAATLLRTAHALLNLKQTETLLDLHSGVGFFAVDLAPSVSRVTGIERNRESVRAARLNAKLNHAGNAEFRERSTERGLQEFRKGEIDAVVLDPPRSGCGEETLAALARLRPGRIVYFSRSPETLAADCRVLKDCGYRLTDCVPIDMFPHTYHMEAAVKLVAV